MERYKREFKKGREKMKKAFIILNPQAGTKQANKSFVEILGIFNKGGYSTTVAITQKRGDGTDFVLKYGKAYDLIVAIGGDGTFNEVMDGVLTADLDVRVGYIPAGSTNDFGSRTVRPLTFLCG